MLETDTAKAWEQYADDMGDNGAKAENLYSENGKYT